MHDARVRGELLSFSAPPGGAALDGATYLQDAVISINNGLISDVQDASKLLASGDTLSDCTVLPGLILPGFIDTHIHYPQMNIIGGYGAHLLDWLERYAFPAEIAYAEVPWAEAQAELFMRTLFRHGTTTAMAFTTVHAHTTDALLGAASRHNARMIAGKVLMNRNAPADLTDNGDGIEESAALLERWHNRGRCAYAITPRFAITCTDQQLGGAAELMQSYPDAYLHTHLAEDRHEIETTLELFPAAKDYVDVYDRFGLLGERSVFAHGIHLSSDELTRLSETGSGIAFCPTSNLFLGSGLLSRARLEDHGVRMSVASDVGGGTSFSMLATLADGYKVGQLNNEPWHPFDALHAITHGNASALGLGSHIGQVAPGYEADFTVLAPQEGSMLAQRIKDTTLAERLFAAFFMAGDDAIAETWVAGKQVFQRAAR